VALRARLRELAAERPRFGYRRLYIFLRRERREDGTLRWRVNHKRVYRLYREEGWRCSVGGVAISSRSACATRTSDPCERSVDDGLYA